MCWRCNQVKDNKKSEIHINSRCSDYFKESCCSFIKSILYSYNFIEYRLFELTMTEKMDPCVFLEQTLKKMILLLY